MDGMSDYFYFLTLLDNFFFLYYCIIILIQYIIQSEVNDMPWDLDENRPIYLQLMEKIQLDIISGVYQAGDRLPSVRELALDASVNPNTMQKALSELERSGLVYSQRTSGRFITEDKSMLKKLKSELAARHIREFLITMKQLGFPPEEALALMKETIKEDK